MLERVGKEESAQHNASPAGASVRGVVLQLSLPRVMRRAPMPIAAPARQFKDPLSLFVLHLSLIRRVCRLLEISAKPFASSVSLPNELRLFYKNPKKGKRTRIFVASRTIRG